MSYNETPPTIPGAAADANTLFDALLTGISSDYIKPVWDVNDDFTLPAPPPDPVYPTVEAITLDQLTTGEVGGTGVLDRLMTMVTAHLEAQCAKGRISGADYAKVYLGSVQAMAEVGTQFLLEKDRRHWETLQAQAALRMALAQETRAHADIQLARAQLKKAYVEFETLNFQLLSQKNEFALTKINLLTGYQSVVNATLEGNLAARKHELAGKDLTLKDTEIQLAGVTYETARAQIYDTMESGAAFLGIVAQEKILKQAQAETAQEQLDTIRANTKETLKSGAAIQGLVAVDKQIKEAQRQLTLEQAEGARAQTSETRLDGVTAVAGIAAKEKALKDAQGKLILEQYESQRGQTRGTLSTGEVVGGMIGAQTALYNQQVTSYKRDGENKALKLMLDTWIARKTIDEGVAVPVEIDTPAIDTAMAIYTNNLQL